MADGLDKALREMLLPKPSEGAAEVLEDAEDEAAAELSEA